MDVCAVLSLYIEIEKLPIVVNINKFLKLIASKKDIEKLAFGPVDDSYDSVARCTNCELSTNREKNLQKKLKNKYALCCNVFHFVPDLDARLQAVDMNFTAQYMDNYKEAIDIVLENTELCNLDRDEKFFKKFKNLTSITLSNNKLKEFPGSILNVKKLKRLSIQNNAIKNFNTTSRTLFKHLKCLDTLELINCPITVQDLGMNESMDLIKLPDTLKLLRLVSLRLNCLPFSLNTCKGSLTELYFSGARWVNQGVSLKETQISRESLVELLSTIGLSESEANKIFDYFDADKNSTLNGEEITKVNAFIYKKFPRLGENFTLDEFNNVDANKTNKFIQSYVSIFEMNNLIILDLSFQAIKFLPDQIESLVNLEKLYLECCVELEAISSKVTELKKLKEFNLNDCISLKTPPNEVNTYISYYICLWRNKL